MAEPNMLTYRKRPNEVRAYVVTVETEVKTLLGVVKAAPGDVIAVGANGEQQVYPAPVFALLYELVK